MHKRLALILLGVATLAPITAAGTATSVGATSISPVPALSDVRAFGNADLAGETNLVTGNAPIVGITRNATSRGYWEAAVDGGVFAFGDARFLGSMGGAHLNQPIVGIAATPTGKGYWLVANDGGVFSFGDARFFGSTGGMHLNQPIVGIAATPSGRGYWLVANDGGVFSFGNARFYGSMGGVPLTRPVVGIASTGTGNGYYLVASDGGVFTFGGARFAGAVSSQAFPVVAIAVRPGGGGYWIVDADGRVSAFGRAPALGDATAADITKPIVGIATTASGNGYWLAGRGTAPVYFLRGNELGAGSRDVNNRGSAGSLINLVRDLVAGPSAAERAAGLTTAIPAGTTVNRVNVTPDRVATVDLSQQFLAAGGTAQARIAQVVFTLTGRPGIDKVSFSIDGVHVAGIGGQAVEPSVSRAAFDSLRPQVMVVTPAPGDIVTSPLVVTGEINSFEGGATFELNAADGRPLANGFGQGAMGFWLSFGSSLGFQPGGVSDGTLIAWPSSGLEGLPSPDAVIPVRFRP